MEDEMAGNTDRGGGAKKYGRNKVKCEAYRRRDQRERNKLRRLIKHAKRMGITRFDGAPGDVRACWEKLSLKLLGEARRMAGDLAS